MQSIFMHPTAAEAVDTRNSSGCPPRYCTRSLSQHHAHSFSTHLYLLLHVLVLP
jgi:hypothetical protein